MNFILYSAIDEKSINTNLGLPEYSYYFLVKAFRRVLATLGSVTVVQHPETEVDPIFEACRQRGESCVFLSFSPPNKTLINLQCPTVSAFACEFGHVPIAQWNDDVRNDWRVVFAKHGRAITLSNYAARAVRQTMGDTFPVFAIRAPLWDTFATTRAELGSAQAKVAARLRIRGLIIDSHTVGLSADHRIQHLWWPGKAVQEPEVVVVETPVMSELLEALTIGQIVDGIAMEQAAPIVLPPKTLRFRLAATKRHLLAWYREVVRDALPLWLAKALAWIARKSYVLLRRILRLDSRSRALPAAEVEAPEMTVEAEVAPAAAETPFETPVEILLPEEVLALDGIVYTSVFAPYDARKNWVDMVTAFVWTFRDTRDATLVLKTAHPDLSHYREALLELLAELSPFQCRVVVLHAHLDDAAYGALIGASTYYVNSSVSEGACLPIQEFMSCGKPVIAPAHTAMEDYIDDTVAFVVKASVEPMPWPNDPHGLFRTLRYRINWDSLCDAYRESYRVATVAPGCYAQMSDSARAKMNAYCSDAVVTEQLRTFFDLSQAAA